MSVTSDTSQSGISSRSRGAAVHVWFGAARHAGGIANGRCSCGVPGGIQAAGHSSLQRGFVRERRGGRDRRSREHENGEEDADARDQSGPPRTAPRRFRACRTHEQFIFSGQGWEGQAGVRELVDGVDIGKGVSACRPADRAPGETRDRPRFANRSQMTRVSGAACVELNTPRGGLGELDARRGESRTLGGRRRVRTCGRGSARPRGAYPRCLARRNTRTRLMSGCASDLSSRGMLTRPFDVESKGQRDHQ